MNTLVKLFLIITLASLSTNSFSGGLVGDFIEGVCGNCGVGKAADKAHAQYKKYNPVHSQIERTGTRVLREVQVETKGPILAEWIRQSRNNTWSSNYVFKIPYQIRIKLSGFFTDEFLNKANYTIGSSHDFNLARHALGIGRQSAIVLDNVIVFRNQSDALNNARLWAHELAHIDQYQRWGVDDFAKRYVRSSGNVEGEAERVAMDWVNWFQPSAYRR